ncbi:hypothetical protein ACRQ5Q_43060 (plasmid) [Bradyrhizobium sp. PMVTL-01]|uniref:hypothetical protein n=1 Tax=Bradyrhizobium sp. PMVTL-01 TaxID=3434999 RepID=UPI003F6F5B90
MKDLFSINRAADLLEKDRATLVRALRHLPPEGYSKHGHPRWSMQTIRNALAVKPQARRETGKFRDRYSLRSTKLDRMRLEYEKGLALIGAEPSLDKRRDMALALAPLLEQYQAAYLEIARSLHIADDDVLTVRSDLIWSEMMDEVSAAAEWPRDEGFFERMYEVMWPHAEDEEVG